jgi:hypothetical protein
MDPITAEMLDDCIHIVNQLLDLREEDRIRIANALQGDQLQLYRKLTDIEQDKLQQLKYRLHALCDAYSMLP